MLGILAFVCWTFLVVVYTKSMHPVKIIKFFRREQVEQELRL